MSISTIDELLAGMKPAVNFFKVSAATEAAGVMSSLWYRAGFPGSGAPNGLPLAGSGIANTIDGQIPFTNPTAPSGAYLARFSGSATIQGTLILADRLWHNDTISSTTTTGQTINSVTWPARDSLGTTNGSGVMVALETSVTTGNGADVTTITMTYTNDRGVNSRTATISAFPTTALTGAFIPFELQSGDTGVQSIQTLTLGTTLSSGKVHLVAYRPLARLDVVVASLGMAQDVFALGMPRLYNNTCPFLIFLPSATTAHQITGAVNYAWG